MYVLGEGLVFWKWAGCHLAKLAEFMVLNLPFSHLACTWHSPCGNGAMPTRILISSGCDALLCLISAWGLTLPKQSHLSIVS